MAHRTGASLRAAILVAITVSGCSVPSRQPQGTGDSGPQFQRELVMRGAWVGRPYAELLRRMGPPRSELGLPGYDGTRNAVFVFGAVDPTAGCLDAFVVSTDAATGAETVTDYHCH